MVMNMENLTTKEKIETYGKEIIGLYLAGNTVRAIAKKFKIPAHDTVSDFLKDNNIEIRGGRVKIKWIDENNIACSRCFEIKNKNYFPFSTSNSREGYYFSYCKECRSKQAKLNRLNSSDSFKERCSKIKKRAEQKNIEFNLDENYLKEIFIAQEGRCFYTNCDIDLSFGRGLQSNSCSVDRVVSERGYIKGNVVLTTHRANTIKSNLTLEEMKKWMPSWHKKIIDFLRKGYEQ